MDLWVYAGSCIMVAGMTFLAVVLLRLATQLSDIVSDPVSFMLRRGWCQCTCCNCLTPCDRVTHVDDFGGSGPGVICPTCVVGGDMSTILQMLLGGGERYYRVIGQVKNGTLTQGALELEVISHLIPDYREAD